MNAVLHKLKGCGLSRVMVIIYYLAAFIHKKLKNKVFYYILNMYIKYNCFCSLQHGDTRLSNVSLQIQSE